MGSLSKTKDEDPALKRQGTSGKEQLQGTSGKEQLQDISGKEQNQRHWISSAVVKWTVALVLVACWLLMPVIGYGGASDNGLLGHVLFPLSHANVWHLLGNLFVLRLIKGRLWLWQGVAISFLCSWLPALPGVWEIVAHSEVGMTIGFSGVLFAVFGIKWGEWCNKTIRQNRMAQQSSKAQQSSRAQHPVREAYWTFVKGVVPFVMLGAIIPHVNWSIHLYCVLTGLFYGRWRGK